MLSEDERILARQSFKMYRNRWREKGIEAAAEHGYNICIGWLERAGTPQRVPEAKKQEYRAYFEELARNPSADS